MHAKYEVSITYGSKVVAKVEVDNRQTDKRQDKNNMPPDHSIRGHKNLKTFREFKTHVVVTRNITFIYWCAVISKNMQREPYYREFYIVKSGAVSCMKEL